MEAQESSRNDEPDAPLARENAKQAKLIAELMQERDLLRTVIDNLPDKIYAKDKRGRFVLNNPTHARAFGLNSPEEMKGKTDFDLFPQELAAQFFDLCRWKNRLAQAVSQQVKNQGQVFHQRARAEAGGMRPG